MHGEVQPHLCPPSPVLLFLQQKEDWTLPASPDLPRPPVLHPLTPQIYFISLIAHLTRTRLWPPFCRGSQLTMGDFLTTLSSCKVVRQMQDLNPRLSASEAHCPSTVLTTTFQVWTPGVLEALLHSELPTELGTYGSKWQSSFSVTCNQKGPN